jgi:uncharacterized protein (TIGR03083 family)
MRSPDPILVADRFPRLDQELTLLLSGLSRSDWNRPTVCVGWSVKDVAGHLLDSAVRRLAIHRDGFVAVGAPDGLDDPHVLASFINRVNQEGVEAFRRVSPPLLIDLLATTTARLHEFLVSLEPFGEAAFPVSWAGESQSANWFDVAREFTERWHHQQQIRDAVGAPPLTDRYFLHPVLDAFSRALPSACRDMSARDGTLWKVEITGQSGDIWYLRRDAGAWRLFVDVGAKPDASVRMDADTAWRLFTGGLDHDLTSEQFTVEGDPAMSGAVLAMRCIVAMRPRS